MTAGWLSPRDWSPEQQAALEQAISEEKVWQLLEAGRTPGEVFDLLERSLLSLRQLLSDGHVEIRRTLRPWWSQGSCETFRRNFPAKHFPGTPSVILAAGRVSASVVLTPLQTGAKFF